MKHSTCLWCYDGFRQRANMGLEAFVEACASMGFHAVDMVPVAEWPLLKKHGMICAMADAHRIEKGLNRTEFHDDCLAAILKSIDDSARWGCPNVVTFSGNSEGMDSEQGLENCVVALKKVAPHAEAKKVTVCLEFLNSINHKDYMANSTAWCVELVKRVNSPYVKVLYDVYHAVMMGEDPIRDIREHHDCWGHYHTGGVPGRHEIDASQTIDYRAIMKEIRATGYNGFVAQEFIPAKENALQSLREAIALCSD